MAGKCDSRRLRVLARMQKWRKRVTKRQKFYPVLRSGEVNLASFNKDDSANFSGGSKVQSSFPGYLFFQNTFSSSNLKPCNIFYVYHNNCCHFLVKLRKPSTSECLGNEETAKPRTIQHCHMQFSFLMYVFTFITIKR